jgi:amino acid permease
MAIFFQLNPSGTGCSAQPGAYNTFYRIFYLMIYCMLPFVCMGLFSILTLKNIRQQARRIRPALVTENDSLRRIDRQMVRMLFSQVLTQLLCILPFSILNLASLFINTTTTIYNFFSQILILPVYVSYTTSFYVFTLSSRVYRQELMKIIRFGKRRQDENERPIRTIAIGTIVRQHRKQ